jgi:hypothetical protein
VSSGGGNNQGGSRCRSWSGGNTLHGKHNRIRAGKFRKCNEFKRVIELVDVDGNCTRVTSQGQMNGTRHETVLQVLTQCVQQFHHRLNVTGPKDSLHTWALDETGTIETSRLLMCEHETEQQETCGINNIVVSEEVLQVHGFGSPKKAKETVWLIYGKANGFQKLTEWECEGRECQGNS